jgi:hypothetical protein
MLRVNGNTSESAKLVSIAWRKPASVEITLSQQESPGANATAPRLADFTDFQATLTGSRVVVNDGVRMRYFTYRMARNIPKSPTDRHKENYQEQWGMNTVLGQQDIQRHPNFPAIKKRYNGSVVTGDRVVWPRYIQDPDGDEKKAIKNPMFGVRSFLAPQVEVSVEIGYSEFPMDFSQLNEVGYVDIPAGFSFFAADAEGSKADWILTDKSFTVVGIDRIERKAWRSQWGGWPREVYKGGIQGAKYDA